MTCSLCSNVGAMIVLQLRTITYKARRPTVQHKLANERTAQLSSVQLIYVALHTPLQWRTVLTVTVFHARFAPQSTTRHPPWQMKEMGR